MRAVTAPTPGGPEALLLGQVDSPQPGPEDLLVDIATTAVNRADVLQRRGMYPPPAGSSDVLGLELVGTISAVGAAAPGWTVGDQICAVVAAGGYAEHAVVPSSTAMTLPPGTDLVTAAAVPEVFATAFDAIILQAGLTSGETVLLHGGSSGVGTAAIQLAKRAGASVAVTVGTEEKAEACRNLGADLVINYRETPDFANAVRVGFGHGVDVVLDIIGGSYLSQNLSVLRSGGRMVTIGLMGGVKAELNMGVLMAKRLRLMGSTLRARPVAEKAALAARLMSDVWPGFEDGSLTPVIHSQYRLEEVALAHAEMEASTHIGKILLTVSE